MNTIQYPASMSKMIKADLRGADTPGRALSTTLGGSEMVYVLDDETRHPAEEPAGARAKHLAANREPQLPPVMVKVVWRTLG